MAAATDIQQVLSTVSFFSIPFLRWQRSTAWTFPFAIPPALRGLEGCAPQPRRAYICRSSLACPSLSQEIRRIARYRQSSYQRHLATECGYYRSTRRCAKGPDRDQGNR